MPNRVLLATLRIQRIRTWQSLVGSSRPGAKGWEEKYRKHWGQIMGIVGFQAQNMETFERQIVLFEKFFLIKTTVQG